jgi:hypothetical protein
MLAKYTSDYETTNNISDFVLAFVCARATVAAVVDTSD